MGWSHIKKLVNDNLDYTLVQQNTILHASAFTESGTFIVPQTGRYIITCVGHGGDGGDCSNSERFAAAGGSGAIARSALTLTANTEIAVTVSSAISSFGGYLSATCGSNGGSGRAISDGGTDPTPGAGGIATGGNIINLNGNDGEGPTYGRLDTLHGASTKLTTINGTNYTGRYCAMRTTTNGSMIYRYYNARGYTNEGSAYYPRLYPNYGGSGFNPLPYNSRGGVPSWVQGASGGSSVSADTGKNFGGDGGGGTAYTNGYAYGGGGGSAFGAGGGASYTYGSGSANSTGGKGGGGLVYIEWFEELFG